MSSTEYLQSPFQVILFQCKAAGPYQLPPKDVRKSSVRKINSLHGSCKQVLLQVIFFPL